MHIIIFIDRIHAVPSFTQDNQESKNEQSQLSASSDSRSTSLTGVTSDAGVPTSTMGPPKRPCNCKNSVQSSPSTSSQQSISSAEAMLEAELKSMREELKSPSVADAFGNLVASCMRQLPLSLALPMQAEVSRVMERHMEAAEAVLIVDLNCENESS